MTGCVSWPLTNSWEQLERRASQIEVQGPPRDMMAAALRPFPRLEEGGRAELCLGGH